MKVQARKMALRGRKVGDEENVRVSKVVGDAADEFLAHKRSQQQEKRERDN